MINRSKNKISNITSSFAELVSLPFHGAMNAICWERKLVGDFSEIIKKVTLSENIVEINPVELREFELNEQGQLAREIILNDIKLLTSHGASPSLNLIKHYERDDSYPFFPTDVYSFHVDRSPIPTDTFLCTYHGAASEIIPNAQAKQKILIPEIRSKLKKLYNGAEDGFEDFLSEHFFDLHYQAAKNTLPTSLGHGHLWRLAVDYPENKALPCVHRAPLENFGEFRLLLIC